MTATPHPRRVRRTKGNLNRFRVEYGVKISRTITPAHGHWIVATYARFEGDAFPLWSDELRLCYRQEEVNRALEDHVYLVLFDLAGQFNAWLDLNPNWFREEDGDE